MPRPITGRAKSGRVGRTGTSVRPIRVLHFISNSEPSSYFPLIAVHTDRSRFKLHVGSLDTSGGLQSEVSTLGFPCFAIGASRRTQYPIATLRLARWLRSHRIDVIHTHLFDASLVGLAAGRLAGTRLKIFTGHHSHEVPLYVRRLLFALDRFAATKLADVVIAPSREMQDTFVSVYGCASDRVELIEHGVDLSRFDPDRVNGRELRSSLGLDGKLVFGAISKYHWVKNLEALIRAFAQIVEGNDSAHLVLLGIGDSSELARLVDQLSLPSHVSFLKPRRDVQQLLAAFDVFVHPALAESFGLAVIEAMAMRLPVVVTPVGIAHDAVEDGVSGLLIRGTDADSIAVALRRAMECRERWPSIGTEARRRALAFTPERWVRAHERLYQRRLG